MDDTDHRDDPFVAVHFLQRYLADQEAGKILPLTHYQALFPGHETLVAEEFRALGEPGMDASPEEKETLGPYCLERELGRGGQGAVYLATDTRLGREVALKVLTGLRTASTDMVMRFQREAEVASRLDHPGICTVYEAGRIEDTPYIAMQYVRGETLAVRIARARRECNRARSDKTPSTRSKTRSMTEQTLALFEAAARALHVAHEAGIVHRDVKPGNLMIMPDEQPVILDFGLARSLEGEAHTLTRTGEVFGTPAYMAPEHLEGSSAGPDRRVDVWALGVSMYEALTLRRPFEAPSREGLLKAILSEEPLNPGPFNPAIQRDLRVVLETALQKNPDRRYQTAHALAEDLRAIREHRPIAARPVSTAARVLRWARRRPALATLVLLLTVGLPFLAGLGGFFLDDVIENRSQRHCEEYEDRLNRAFRLLHTGYFDRAEQVFQEVLALESPSEDLFTEAVGGLAFTRLFKGEPDRALAFLREHEKLLTARPGLRQIKVDALQRLGRSDEADRMAGIPREVASAVDEFLLASRGMLQYEERVGDRRALRFVREAIDHYQQAIFKNPRPRFQYYSALGVAAMMTRNRTLARETSGALAELWPDRPSFGRAAAMVIVDHRKAIPLLEEFIQMNPAEANMPRNTLGSIFWSLGKHEEALSQFEQSHQANPGIGGYAYANQLTLLRFLGLLEKALASARTAVVGDPKNPDHQIQLGITLLAMGKQEAAGIAFERALRLDRDRSRALIRIAFYAAAYARRLCWKGDLSGAKRIHEAVSSIAPEDPWILNELAFRLVQVNGMKQDVYRYGLEQAEKASRLSGGGEPMILESVAFGLFRTGRIEEAVETEKHVLDLMAYRDRPERTVDEVLERIAFYHQAAKE